MAVFTDATARMERERKARQEAEEWQSKLGTIMGIGGAAIGGVAGGFAGGPMGAMSGAQAGYGLGQTAAGLVGDGHQASLQRNQGVGNMWSGARTGMLGDGKNPGAWSSAYDKWKEGNAQAGSMGAVSPYGHHPETHQPMPLASGPAAEYLKKKRMQSPYGQPIYQ